MAIKWEQLPGDLLRNVEDKLIWYADKVRLHSVCKTWQSELTTIPPGFRLPLLLLPSKLERVSHVFLDITDNITYGLALRDYSLGFIGSFKGWAVATYYRCGKEHVFMFNPLTGSQKPLPSALITAELEIRDFAEYIYRCVLSSNQDDYKAVALARHGHLSWSEFGDDTWHVIPIATAIFVVDMIFHEGQLYGLTRDGQLLLVEIGSANPRVIPISSSLKPKDYNGLMRLRLVDSRIGLLLIESIPDKDDYRLTSQYDVYKYDSEASEWSSKLTDIGDEMLFVGGNVLASRYRPNLMGLKPNTVCFFDYHKNRISDVIHMKVLDLKTGNMEVLSDFDYSSPRTPFWFSPITDS